MPSFPALSALDMPTAPQPRRAVRSAILAGLDPSVTGLIAGLEAEGVHTWSAESADEVERVASELTPEVVLLGDAMFPELPTLVRALRGLVPGVRILLLPSAPETQPLEELVATGVDDILAGPFTAPGVLLRVQVGVLLEKRRERRSGSTDPSIVVDRFSRSLEDPSGTTTLTSREFDLLERLARAGGRVVPREHLLADIWGSEQDNEAVLDATVHRLRRKLERDHEAPQLLVTIRGVGYRLESSRIRISEN